MVTNNATKARLKPVKMAYTSMLPGSCFSNKIEGSISIILIQVNSIASFIIKAFNVRFLYVFLMVRVQLFCNEKRVVSYETK